MKLIPCASVVLISMLAFGAFSARAALGVVTNYSLLNLSLIIKTNKGPVTVKQMTKISVGTAKFGTKELLNLLQTANWANMSFPTGAKIVVGWDSPWNSQILVVDKTGTNVLYAVPNGGTQQFVIYFNYQAGAFTETFDQNLPGFDLWNETYTYYVQLEDDSTGLKLAGYPTGQQNYNQKWDKNGTYTTWTDTETIFMGGGLGGSQEVDYNPNGSVTGTINLTGKGKGFNPFWNAVE